LKDLPHSAVIYGYLKKYQDDPTSRVFAPLAEAYRKAGLVDQAIQIAEEGLRVHPGFISGKVALSRALFDKKNYARVVEELKPVLQEVPDNIVAQRLMAESSLMLGRSVEALSSYKMLLYFMPNDQEIAQMVRELEIQAFEKGSLVIQTDHDIILGIDMNDKERWIKKIEFLQGLLKKVERYRLTRLS